MPYPSTTLFPSTSVYPGFASAVALSIEIGLGAEIEYNGLVLNEWSPTTTIVSRENLVKNPSFEVDTASWSTTTPAFWLNTSGATLTRSATGGIQPASNAPYGSLVAPNTALNFTGAATQVLPTDGSQFIAGTTYTFSVYLKLFAGLGTNVQIFFGDTVSNNNGSSTLTITSSWVRYAVTWTPATTTSTGYVGLRNTAGVGVSKTIGIDGAQVEGGVNATSYFDGSFSSSQWVGTAHNSASQFLLTGADSDKYAVKSLSLSMPEIRDAREINPADHGETSYTSLYADRPIVIEGQIRAGNLAKLRTMSNDLRAAFGTLTDAPLIFRPDDGSGRDAKLIARTTGLSIAEQNDSLMFRRNFQVTMRAGRPFVLSNDEVVLEQLYSGGTSVTLTNAGNFSAQPVYRITGPVTNPSISNATNSMSLTLNGTIPSGDYVDIDVANRTIIDNSGANKFSLISDASEWVLIEPGTNSLTIGGSGTSGAASVTFTYNDTWL